MSLRYTISRPDATGECRITMRIVLHRQKREVNTGIKTQPQYWDHTRHQLKANAPQAAYINRMLATKLSQCVRIEVELREHSQGISISRLQQDIQRLFSGDHTQHTYFTFARAHIESLRMDGRHGHATTIQQHLNRFEQFVHGRQLTFTEVDEQLLTRFRRYLTDAGCSSTTTGNHLRSLRLLYNAAIAAKLVERNSYPFTAGIIPAKSLSHKKNITGAQVRQLIELLHSGTLTPARERSLRVWLCCFYLRGIDFVDLAHLTPKNLQGDYIVFIRQKTARKRATAVKVLLTPQLRELMKPLRNKSGAPLLLHILPQPANTSEAAYIHYKSILNTTSKHLIAVGEAAGFGRALSMKMNRHTFASVSRECGVDRDTIAAMLGHTNNGVTDLYIEHQQYQLDDAHLRVLKYVEEVEQIEKFRKLQG